MKEEQIRKMLREEISVMQDSGGNTISRLFYDNKETTSVNFTRLEGKMDEMIGHVKETNGRLKAAEKDIVTLTDTIDDKHHKTKTHLYKVLGVTLLIGTFIWVKESRDFLLEIIFKIV